MNNEYIWIMEEDEEPNPLYGMETNTITKDMLKALQDGKRLYMTVNGEYAVVLKLCEEDDKK
jgi:hypothetical protein